MFVDRTHLAPGAQLKKGRHRRFEEARKLKQSGPGAFGGFSPRPSTETEVDEDARHLEELAKKYGAFDDDEEVEDDE
jgi:hypothetical protein